MVDGVIEKPVETELETVAVYVLVPKENVGLNVPSESVSADKVASVDGTITLSVLLAFAGATVNAVVFA